jgi:hypothetical protein
MIRIYERTCIEEFTIDSIAAGASGSGELDFLAATEQNIFNGILRGVSVACSSVDFDISIRTKADASADTVDEIYKAVDINKYRSDDNLYQGWTNGDTPMASKLYAFITNTDGVNATGTITIKIVTEINKKFSKNSG